MSIVEHAVEMTLPGNPRWWTVTNHKGAREVVRVVFDRETYFPNAKDAEPGDPPVPDEMLIYVLMPEGLYAWPPLCSATLRMGTPGWKDLQDKGAQIVVYEEPLGKKLELMLVASR